MEQTHRDEMINLMVDAPASVRYHREIIEQVIQCVEERIYCALLGPRLCGKTLLLQYLERHLAGLLGWTCVYIDLEDLRAATQQTFFADLIQHTANRLTELSSISIPTPPDNEASSAIFRAFLHDCLGLLHCDLVLMIDPLEALPTDLAQALLTSLRAAYMDQQMQDYQVTVILSGALSLATLTLGESSPFRGIARRVFIDDLSSADSLAMILEYLAENGVNATRPAIERLHQATCGDLFLIRKLCQDAVDLTNARRNRQLRVRDVDTLINHFLGGEVLRYAPLVEAIRLMEDDPDLLICVLKILHEERVLRSALPLPLSPDLDPLYLTGVFQRDVPPNEPSGEAYQFQNMIYRRFLIEHFTPARVGHVLTMTGRWDTAMDYLGASILEGNRQSIADLLPATINSMYAAETIIQAVRYLRNGLATAFDLREVQVWFCPAPENQLRRVGPLEADQATSLTNEEGRVETTMNVQADRLEARAFRQRAPLRGQESELSVVRAFPLLIQGKKAIGVVSAKSPALLEGQAQDGFLDLRERDQHLTGFLSQAARALHAVHIRRRELTIAGKVQASLLPDRLPEKPGWQVAARWQPAHETSGDFYDCIPLPDGKLAVVIADVVDKGMGAALLMTLTRTLIRTYADEFTDEPGRLLQVTNQRIIADLNYGQFVTLFYGVLDPFSGRLTYCNAGHPPPIYVAGDSSQPETTLNKTGMALGVEPEESWAQAVQLLCPGSVLLLYTDGLLEMQNQRAEFFGYVRILNSLQCARECNAQEIRDLLFAEVLTFAGSEPQADDMTMLVIKRERSNHLEL